MPLLAAFAFANLKHDFGLLWQWLCHRSFWQLVSMALAAFALVQHFQLVGERRHSAKVEAARHADRETYTKAQADAQAKNDAQIARVKQKQQEINDAQVSTLDARLQLIRSELSKRPTPQSHPVGTQAGNPGSAPCVASDPAWMCLSPAQRLSAAENEERHDELIDWNLQQSKVDPNN